MMRTAPFVLAACLAVVAGRGAVADPPRLLPLADVANAVSLAIGVAVDGTIAGTMTNHTDRRVGDVEVLVEYAWMWARDGEHDDTGPGWSRVYTLPVTLAPGASAPVNIAPLIPLAERDDGHFLISAKVVGYTRYRWVAPGEPQPSAP